MAKRPSPLFLAGIDAYAALGTLSEKLGNVRRRPLTKSERYALGLALDGADAIADALERRDVRAMVTRR